MGGHCEKHPAAPEGDNPGRSRAIFAPYIPAGVIPAAQLKELARVMEQEGATNVKLTGEIVFVWDTPRHPANLEEKTGAKSNTFRFAGVRPVKMCSAETFCERFVRPVLGLALEIDRRFRGETLPAKLSIGVAGCARSCSEPATKDIGVTGHPDGYEIKVGGAAGLKPKVGVRLAIMESEEDVLAVIGRIISFARERGGSHARLWKLIEQTGFEEFSRIVTGEARTRR
ncbi:MAG: hypothetical protein HZB29_10455 [Nitrospinae bacterium]|nr:hypothetical protein [Nitrospinota bacterium]